MKKSLEGKEEKTIPRRKAKLIQQILIDIYNGLASDLCSGNQEINKLCKV